MKFIVRLIVTAVIAYGLSMLLKPHVFIDSFSTALIFIIVLSLFNAIIKPLLIVLTLPITILTLGIFLLIINVFMIMLADKFVAGIHIDGFWWALIFGSLLSFASSAISNLQKK